MSINVNYVSTPTGNTEIDKNLNDIAIVLNAILIAIQELQKKAGV